MFSIFNVKCASEEAMGSFAYSSHKSYFDLHLIKEVSPNFFNFGGSEPHSSYKCFFLSGFEVIFFLFYDTLRQKHENRSTICFAI